MGNCHEEDAIALERRSDGTSEGESANLLKESSEHSSELTSSAQSLNRSETPTLDAAAQTDDASKNNDVMLGDDGATEEFEASELLRSHESSVGEPPVVISVDPGQRPLSWGRLVEGQRCSVNAREAVLALGRPKCKCFLFFGYSTKLEAKVFQT